MTVNNVSVIADKTQSVSLFNHQHFHMIIDTALNCRELTLSFGSKKALDSLSFVAPAKGVTALLGKNGAGKSTFINCALGLTRANSGSLSLLGRRIPGDKLLKQLVGAMLQDVDLPDLLTPREHLTLLSSYYQDAFTVDELIHLTKLKGFADKRYKKLSGGQKRRVQFAAAIVGKPRLIFLDEPTSGLDADARRTLWNTVRELSANGSAILLTTHYLEEADALADHTAVIDQGKLVIQGSAADIRAQAQGSVIRCQTDITIDQLQDLPGVLRVVRRGRLCEIQSVDTTASLKQLLQIDPSLTDLSVITPTLEETFDELIANQERN